ncbi:MAG: serine/threonine-protein kinase [Myxococcota bacterium]
MTSNPQLSRYQVLGRLAAGGMAEVWLARAVGAAGFEKLVVVKTILPSLARVPQFVSMFVNEARLAAMLSHPNCVQIFDLGEENGWLYIAMEFVEGFSLARIMKRARSLGVPVPERVVARVIMDAASGLEYAHRLRDREGRALNIVHRDVSPDNVLVGFSGQVKLVDFGIAKAATPAALSAGTMAGTVKGKHGYIAPEYLRGENIDGRADLFALGVVMYRALTGKRPFPGDNEAAVSMAVLTQTPPPLQRWVPTVNAELAAVTLRALEKDPAARFESARALRQAVEAAVGRPAENEELADLMQTLWPPGDEERVALNSLAAGTSEETSSPALNAISGTFPSLDVATPHRANPRPSAPGAAPPPPAPPAAPPAAPRPSGPRAAAAPSASLPPVVVPDAAPPPQPVFDAPPAAAPAFPEVPRGFDDGGKVRTSLVVALVVAALAGAGIVAYRSLQNTEPVAAVAAPTTTPAPSDSAAPAPGKVHLATTPSVKVYEGDKELGSTPLDLERPPGEYTFRLVNKGAGVDQAHTVKVEAGKTAAVEELARGKLAVRAEPWADVKVDGRSLGTTPVSVPGLFEGPHTVELSNITFGAPRRMVVTVKRGETKTVKVDFDAE